MKKVVMQKDTVSIVVPIYNEEKNIKNLVNSILNQDYTHDLIELVFIDGNSTDNSVSLLKKYMKKSDIKYSILCNPRRVAPVSVNIGIKNSSNDIIVRMDAHTEYPSNYVSKCIYYLNKTGADNVGCLAIATSKSKMGAAISDVISSRFGVGNSKFRINGASGYVDTVPFGTFRKKLIDKIGYFNEELIRSEDNEFNYRIIKNGGKVYLFNDVCSYYYSRDSIFQFMKMGFGNGKYAIYTGYYIPGSMKIRHFIPFLFALSLIIGVLVSFFRFIILKYLFLIELLLYFILDLIFSLKNIKKGILHSFLMFIIYPLFHISYGIGSFFGIGKIIKKRICNYEKNIA